MADTYPIRMRATHTNSTVLVKVLVQHPMHSGIARDEQGQIPPAHHITQVSVVLNGQPRIEANIGPGVSRNPLFGWRLAGVAIGDEVTFVWKDNLGKGGQQSVKVS